jgi:hypothetical protein
MRVQFTIRVLNRFARPNELEDDGALMRPSVHRLAITG